RWVIASPFVADPATGRRAIRVGVKTKSDVHPLSPDAVAASLTNHTESTLHIYDQALQTAMIAARIPQREYRGTIIALHGAGTNRSVAAVFDPLIPVLEKRFKLRAVAPDNAFHGRGPFEPWLNSRLDVAELNGMIRNQEVTVDLTRTIITRIEEMAGKAPHGSLFYIPNYFKWLDSLIAAEAKRTGGGPVFLLGKSFGANLSLEANMRGALPSVDAFFAMSAYNREITIEGLRILLELASKGERDINWHGLALCLAHERQFRWWNQKGQQGVSEISGSRPIQLMLGAVDETYPKEFYRWFQSWNATAHRGVPIYVAEGAGHNVLEMAKDSAEGLHRSLAIMGNMIDRVVEVGAHSPIARLTRRFRSPEPINRATITDLEALRRGEAKAAAQETAWADARAAGEAAGVVVPIDRRAKKQA
ncbi:MAG: hypothetical protein Q7S68_00755, partial [Deltaproteobacteria bacterium]|nr:hypothetical protein [Deltaproteobacteria bacterium]